MFSQNKKTQKKMGFFNATFDMQKNYKHYFNCIEKCISRCEIEN